MTEQKEKTSFIKHWPTMCFGLIVAIIFLVSIFTYQVKSTEKAVVTFLGKIKGVKDAGLHFKLPYPIQNVFRYDVRYRCFDGNVGKLEETFTKDGKNIVVGIYVIYKIEDPEKFYRSVVTVADAEDRLNSIMRTVKNATIGKYDFSELINTNPDKIKLKQVEIDMKQKIAELAEQQYGVLVDSVGIKSMGVPESISEKVFQRMISERKVVAEKYRAEGKKIADQIKAEADKQKELKLADAQAQSKRIRAKGDAEAASHYAAFRKDPELAAFLRELDSLKKVMKSKSTLILDTDYIPFNLLKSDPTTLSSSKSGNNTKEK